MLNFFLSTLQKKSIATVGFSSGFDLDGLATNRDALFKKFCLEDRKYQDKSVKD